MLTYLRKRILSSAIPLIVVIIGVFFLARMTGDPSSLYLPLNATEQMRIDFAARNGLDQPIWVQMLDYFGGIFQLDFGTSMRTGEDAAVMALRAFPATLQLAAFTMLIAIILAVIVGSAAALKHNGILDRFASFVSMIAASIPDFWLAIVGIVFAVIGAFYYLRVIKVMYIDEPAGEPLQVRPGKPLQGVFSINALALLVLGCAWSPVMAWCQRAFGI